MTATKNTIIGSPPTLEWLGIDQLHVDETYQRSTATARGQSVIKAMMQQWDWSLCQPLAVVRRDDGHLWVVDGQHRLAGARARGDIPHLPCVITRQPSIEAESAMFVALNTRRSQLKQGDIFHAACASGNDEALLVARLVEQAGLSFARHNTTNRWTPGQIFCGPMLAKAITIHGDAVVRNALTALAEANPGRVMTSSATVLRALLVIYSEDAKQPGFDPDLFIEALATLETHEWIDEGRSVQVKQPGLSRIDAIATAMIETMDALKLLQRDFAAA